MPTLPERFTDPATGLDYIEKTIRLPEKGHLLVQHWVESNKPKLYAEFKDNLLHGIFAQHYPNGQMNVEAYYEEDQRVDIYREFYENGKKSLEIEYQATGNPMSPVHPFSRKTYYNSAGDVVYDVRYDKDNVATLHAYQPGM